MNFCLIVFSYGLSRSFEHLIQIYHLLQHPNRFIFVYCFFLTFEKAYYLSLKEKAIFSQLFC